MIGNVFGHDEALIDPEIPDRVERGGEDQRERNQAEIRRRNPVASTAVEDPRS